MFRFNRDNGSLVPCKGCEERHEACHAECPRYKEWRAELDRVNENAQREKKKMDTMSAASKREIWRNARYSRQQRGRSGTER